MTSASHSRAPPDRQGREQQPRTHIQPLEPRLEHALTSDCERSYRREEEEDEEEDEDEDAIQHWMRMRMRFNIG